MRATLPLILGLGLAACHSGVQEPPPTATAAGADAAKPSAYFDNAGRKDVLAGGVRMIPIKTPKGEFRVWTKRVGNNPTIKVLLLHGVRGGKPFFDVKAGTVDVREIKYTAARTAATPARA